MSSENNFQYRLLSNVNRERKYYDRTDTESDHTAKYHKNKVKKKVRFATKESSFRSTSIIIPSIDLYDRLSAKTRLKLKVTLLGAITLLSIVLICIYVTPINEDQISHLNIRLNATTRSFHLLNTTKHDQILVSGQLGCDLGYEIPLATMTDNQLILTWEDKASLTIEQLSNDCTMFLWQAVTVSGDGSTAFRDCFDLKRGFWYSGSEMPRQLWPLQDTEIDIKEYISSYKTNSFGPVMEKIWFNSQGIGIIANHTERLYVQVINNRLCLQSHVDNQHDPLHYEVCSRPNLIEFYQSYAMKIFGKPAAANDDVFGRTIWTTNQINKINQSTVEENVNLLRHYNFHNNDLKIDNQYSTAYGDFNFDPVRFPNATGMISYLHQLGFRLILSVSLIANIDSVAFQEGVKKSYWVKHRDKNNINVALIQWPQGNGALLDVTNPQARNWFVNRLKLFQRLYNIDGFNFICAESDYLPTNVVTFKSIKDPNQFTQLFSNMVANISSSILTEAAYQSQQLSNVIQMYERDSNCDTTTGLPSIIPSTLTLGLIGYPVFAPPVFHSCNGKDLSVDKLPSNLCHDLYIRWLHISIFLPVLELSVDIDPKTIAILQHLIQFRQTTLLPQLIKANYQLKKNGLPIIRPIWWLAPHDVIAQQLKDEFLIGDQILVAPIVNCNVNSRHIYLPRGIWVDHIRMMHYTVAVGQWLRNYTTDYRQVAYFLYSPWKEKNS